MPTLPAARNRIRPFLTRSAARFTCFGDGFCCSDIHFLGPLLPADRLLLDRRAPGSYAHDEERNRDGLRTTERGDCVLLSTDGRCTLHAQDGPQGKPIVCRGYPYALVATPDGGRISTAHRCPCRTLGSRARIDVGVVEASLRLPSGRIQVRDRAPPRIPLTRRSRVSFATYARLEATMIDRLDAGEPPLAVLGADPELPPLQDVKWTDVAEVFLQLGNGRTRAEVAIRWFGGALMALATHRDLEAGERPWKGAFDHAESRTTEVRDPRVLFNDWLADEIWGLGWLTVWPLDVARGDWTVCLMLLDVLTRSLIEAGHRADRAAAEALMIVELSSTLVEWGATVRALRQRRA